MLGLLIGMCLGLLLISALAWVVILVAGLTMPGVSIPISLAVAVACAVIWFGCRAWIIRLHKPEDEQAPATQEDNE